ncbi:stage V sporulation protein AB [Lentibacillus amyloliquefaciens]|uniref:Stage V sporulation protein AB n=1 Tax=Lentibacillus amyloliquefaciens TaxID=1472767 RepID=A0A0U4E553_9BACI|nr:stage V sporulation protein AB [Lentibacillus amyloliquefaciens]ALX48001.1 stage V sporulation protein AB [Lentibacillus amyloliquefaciens]
MIADIVINLLEVLIGFAAGIAVGGGFVAFLTLLGVIPRLIQLSKTAELIPAYIASIILGSLLGTYFSFAEVSFNQPIILLVLWGVFHGIFNGMLAAALTEVLNVFPIMSKRIRLEEKLLWLLMAIVFGKIAGSLFQWTIFVK